jgi:Family of unknown function (DUF5338)
MSKNLSERISVKVNQEKPRRGKQSLATFLALKPEIEGAINDGWPVKLIWETLHQEKKVSFGYQMFLRLVNRHHMKKDQKAAGNALPKKDRQEFRKANPGSGIQQFNFDSSTNQEDLI